MTLNIHFTAFVGSVELHGGLEGGGSEPTEEIQRAESESVMKNDGLHTYDGALWCPVPCVLDQSINVTQCLPNWTSIIIIVVVVVTVGMGCYFGPADGSCHKRIQTRWANV